VGPCVGHAEKRDDNQQSRKVLSAYYFHFLIAVSSIRYSDAGSGILPAANHKEMAASMEQQ
jgi:hypothetical protein